MKILMLVTALVVASPAGPKTAGQASIDDFAWLAGHWRGEGFGAEVEEIWSQPLGGTMVGTFRLVKEAGVDFYEIMLIGPVDEGFALRVKHFSGDFTAWEEKADSVDFQLESVEENHAIFKGLTLKRDGGTLEIKIRMRSKDGSTRWETLSFRSYQP